jgi:hypothetical protein
MNVGVLLIVSAAVVVVLVVVAGVLVWGASSRGAGDNQQAMTPAMTAPVESMRVDESGVTDPIERGLLKLISMGPKGEFITVDRLSGKPHDTLMQFAGPGEGFSLLVTGQEGWDDARRERLRAYCKRQGLNAWEDGGFIFVDTPLDAKASTKIGRDVIEQVLDLPRNVDVKVY